VDTATGPIKILVVDDEPDVPMLMRQRFRKQLQDKSVEILFAANGVEALAQLDAHPDIDMILSDINMPEMDGLTLLGKVTDRGPMPKTVMVSAYGDMDNIRAAMNRGAFDFVTKPIDFTDLQKTIDKTRSELALIKTALRSRDELVGLRRELEIAAAIQRALLTQGAPAGMPAGAFEIYAEVVPATEVGGDFYDYFMIDPNRLGFVVADVSGKGVAAAIYMAVSRTLLRAGALVNPTWSAADLVNRLNTLLCLSADAGMFVTVCYGILDLTTGELDYATAGHPQPWIFSPAGVRELPKAPGAVVGMMEDLTFGSLTTTIQPGEALLVYSDGVNEAMNEVQDQYSTQRVGEFLGHTAAGSPLDVTNALVADVKRHAGTAPQSDDITVLVVRYLGKPA
jgi:sigma-B regulation protein RsbU (phosphoserine phosphatase)